MTLAYPVRLVPEPDQPGVFNVQGIAPMDGVITYGESREHALEMAREALTGILLSMLKHNESIPRPPLATGPDVFLVEPEPVVVAPILLRWAREEAGLTQSEVADRLKVTYQSYQRLERGDANPSIKTLAKVARALGRDLHIAI